MNRLVNVPDINAQLMQYGIECTYNEKSNHYEIHTVDLILKERKIGMGFDICGTTPKSIAMDIAEALTQMRNIGFEQGRKYVRDALGIKS